MKKNIFFQRWQRCLIWIIIMLLIIVSISLLVFSWRLTRLHSLTNLSSLPVFPVLFKGEIMSEAIVTNLDNFSQSEDLSFLSSPDGRNFAYILKTDQGQQLIFNKKAQFIVDQVTFMAFSPNSQSFAYTFKLNGKERAVINGILGKEYDWIFSPRFFTPDSRYFIYKARKNGQDLLVVNHQESRPYDRIYEPFLSPDKSTLIFFAREGNNLWRGEIPLSN